jgi:hypothetical protein
VPRPEVIIEKRGLRISCTEAVDEVQSLFCMPYPGHTEPCDDDAVARMGTPRSELFYFPSPLDANCFSTSSAMISLKWVVGWTVSAKMKSCGAVGVV